jgi:transposase
MDEVSRHEHFCQLRSTIRNSNNHLIVGIDIAKDKHHAFFGTPKGQSLLRRLIFTNDADGYRRLVEQVEALICQHQLEQVVFGMEPTGNYHKPLADWLIGKGYDVVLVGGKAVRDNRQLLDGRWDKNDTKDSANVADLIGQGKCQFFEYPANHLRVLRNLLSLRNRLKKEEHRLRMRIRNSLLAKYFPEMDRYWGSCLEENLAIVKWYLDPKKISATSLDQFISHVTRTDRGQGQVRRLRAIHETAKASVGLCVDSAAQFEAQMLVDRLQSVREEIAQTMKQMKTVCEQLPAYRLLLTIPGFGPYISALVLANIGQPWRFANHKQVIRLAGLDLNANRSGKTSNASVPVISKKGDAELRYGLYQAGLVASNSHPVFRTLFQRMLDGRQGERGIRTKMRVKLSAKMLIIAWSMLKKNESFDANRLAVEPGHQR